MPKYFDGTADEINEYTVAVDALGRAPEFDPKQDSIIRVQFHRMRERLSHYYSSDGANHAVQIVIPPGQYAPRFVFRADASGTELESDAVQLAEAPPPKAPLPLEDTPSVNEKKSPSRSSALLVAVCLIGLSVLGGVLIILQGRSEAPNAVKAAAAVAMPVGDSIRIMSGLADGSYTDGYGHTWLSRQSRNFRNKVWCIFSTPAMGNRFSVWKSFPFPKAMCPTNSIGPPSHSLSSRRRWPA